MPPPRVDNAYKTYTNPHPKWSTPKKKHLCVIIPYGSKSCWEGIRPPKSDPKYCRREGTAGSTGLPTRKWLWLGPNRTAWNRENDDEPVDLGVPHCQTPRYTAGPTCPTGRLEVTGPDLRPAGVHKNFDAAFGLRKWSGLRIFHQVTVVLRLNIEFILGVFF